MIAYAFDAECTPTLSLAECRALLVRAPRTEMASRERHAWKNRERVTFAEHGRGLIVANVDNGKTGDDWTGFQLVIRGDTPLEGFQPSQRPGAITG